jgi:hypothetical protein
MKIALIVAAVLILLASHEALIARPQKAHGALALQLPWPTGQAQKVDGGNTYGCGTHTGPDQWAIDFWFDPSISSRPVAAAAGGVVVASNFDSGYGWFVDIDHGGGHVSRYAHFSVQGIAYGSAVVQGQTIGNAGTTGFSTGIHLHFRLLRNGVAQKAEPMSNITGFGSYGFSNEDGSCDYDGPSPWWSSMPPASIMAVNWGSGDGNDDFATWRPSNGNWHKRGVGTVQFGGFGDIPAPGYYSGTNTAHPAVYRPCEVCAYPWLSYWLVEGVFVQNATSYGDFNGNGTTDSRIQWGLRGDITVPGDYNGGG